MPKCLQNDQVHRRQKVIRSYPNECFILEEALGRIFGIILLILVKEARPGISGYKKFRVKIAYVSSMAVELIPSTSQQVQ